MKNLPEDELFNSVENRLRNYSELPDDEVWNRISGAIPSGIEPKWVVWTNRTAATLSIVVLVLLFYRENISYTGLAITPTSRIVEGEKKAGQPQPPIDPANELTTPAGASKASKELSPNSTKVLMQRSENDYTHTDETVRSNLMPKQLDKDNGEITINEQQTAEPVNNNRSLIAATATVDSILSKTTELKKDSVAGVVGHVLPPPKKRKKSKLTFYSMVSPSLSFQHVTPNSEDGVVVDKINSPGVISHERLGFNFETGIQGRISERFQYLAGLSYYQQSQQISYEEKSDVALIESGDDLNYDIKPATITRTFDYSMRNVGVQAGILYTLKQRGLMHKAGVVFQYQKGLMKANESDVYDNSSSDYLNYQLVYRVEYAFRSGIGLFVQPVFTHSLIANESLNAPFEIKQSRASLGVGIVYRF